MDTLELWKFGIINIDFFKTDGQCVGHCFPKEDIDGSMVGDVYYNDDDLDSIIKYCELDVITTAQVFLRLRNEELLVESEIKRI